MASKTPIMASKTRTRVATPKTTRAVAQPVEVTPPVAPVQEGYAESHSHRFTRVMSQLDHVLDMAGYPASIVSEARQSIDPFAKPTAEPTIRAFVVRDSDQNQRSHLTLLDPLIRKVLPELDRSCLDDNLLINSSVISRKGLDVIEASLSASQDQMLAYLAEYQEARSTLDTLTVPQAEALLVVLFPAHRSKVPAFYKPEMSQEEVLANLEERLLEKLIASRKEV